jgi:hypothetical protein
LIQINVSQTIEYMIDPSQWEIIPVNTVKTVLLAGICVAMMVGSAAARNSNDNWSPSRSERTYNEPATKFYTSECKTADCYSNHPSGAFVHPIAPPKGS